MDDKLYFEQLSDEEILRSFSLILPYLNKLCRDDTAFAIADKEKYLYYQSADGFDLNLKPGSEILPQTKECVKTGQVIKGDLPKSALGKDIKFIVEPLKNFKGEIIGTISNGIDVENFNRLAGGIDEISQSSKQVSDSISELANASVQLSQSAQSTLNSSAQAIDATKKNSEALDIVKIISDKINLLGLNASIESARAGEFGRGFNVVSGEIRKLSNQSKDAVVTIRNTMKEMDTAVKSITTTLQDSAAASEAQTASIEEISATIENINLSLQKLNEFTKRFL